MGTLLNLLLIVATGPFLGTAAMAMATTSAPTGHQRVYVTPDFFIETVKSQNQDSTYFPQTKSVAKNKDCRKKIQSIMCLVDPPEEGHDPSKRTCQSGGEAYAQYFETLYDFYPSTLQRMFCSLDVIFIEKNFFGTAYAGLLKDENGKVIGAQMGIRKSVLDDGLDLTTWASWKEQLSFGGITDSYTFSPHLPVIETSSPITTVSDFLYFVVAHEFGHIFDFSNKLNKIIDCPEAPDGQERLECEMDPDSWGGISWITDKRPKPQNDFLNRSFLCFYWCNGNPIDPEKVPQIYADLYYDTDFISIYATTQPWDDFADSFAYFLMSQNLNSTYKINAHPGESYDVIAKLNSPLWKKKYEYLEEFLKRTDIIYP